MNRSSSYIIGAFIIALAFVWIAKIGSETALTIKNKGYIVVKGFSAKKIQSDLAILKASIIVQEKDLKAGYKKIVEDKNKTEAFLRALGFRDSNYFFLPLQIKEKYKLNENGYETNEFVEYKLTQDIQIEDRDVKRIANLASKMPELLDQDLKIFINPPQYLYSKLDDLKVTMLGKAMANAKDRALSIAKEGRFRLGAVSSVRSGVFQITPLYSNEIEDYGVNDTTSMDKEIKSIVEVQYFVR